MEYFAAGAVCEASTAEGGECSVEGVVAVAALPPDYIFRERVEAAWLPDSYPNSPSTPINTCLGTATNDVPVQSSIVN